jgi:uncharacterized protein YcbK (DUF882 family)
MVSITPGVVIKNAQWYYEEPVTTPLRIPPPPVKNTMVPEHLLPLKNYCQIGDIYAEYVFSLAMYKRAKAVSRTSVRTYIPPPPPRPRPRPNRTIRWSENITKKVLEETDRVLRATKKAGRAIIDLTKRKVSGNGQRMVLEPRTARMFLELERQWGEKLNVRWAFRDKSLNRKVGGRPRSYHLSKKAVDIVHGGWSKAKMRRFVRLAYRIGFRGFGMGGNVIHLDTRASFTSWNYGGNRYGLAHSMIR